MSKEQDDFLRFTSDYIRASALAHVSTRLLERLDGRELASEVEVAEVAALVRDVGAEVGPDDAVPLASRDRLLPLVHPLLDEGRDLITYGHTASIKYTSRIGLSAAPITSCEVLSYISTPLSVISPYYLRGECARVCVLCT